MDKVVVLHKLLNGTASQEEVDQLKQALVSGEVSIGGNVNQSVIVIGSGNTAQLPPQVLERLGGSRLLGNLKRDLTGDEIARGLAKFESELLTRAPVLFPRYKKQARQLSPFLKVKTEMLSDQARKEL